MPTSRPSVPQYVGYVGVQDPLRLPFESRLLCRCNNLLAAISLQAVICGQPYIYKFLLLQLVLKCVHYLLAPQRLIAAIGCSLNGSLGSIQDFLNSLLRKKVTTSY